MPAKLANKSKSGYLNPMPELPEVETTLRGIAPHVLNRVVASVVIRNNQLRWPIPDELPRFLEGQQLLGIKRRGKYLLFEFARGHALMHLGMSGSLRIVDSAAIPNKHDHFDWVFSDLILRYHDPRRFGSLLWIDGKAAQHPLLDTLGPEPLTDNFTADYVYDRSRKRTQAVKQFIMDSHTVVGVGNIYANEALFMAAIKPIRKAGSLTRLQCELLVSHIKQVLARAIDQGGTTLRDFVGGDGAPGYFQQQLLVYGRGGEPCRHCKKRLKEVRMNGRTTVYCVSCQK
jgi:formamidopyrimidine-DNA glycosylase